MIEAVIFDMDGVLADTEYYYENRRKNFLLENGIPIPEGNFIGSNEKAIWEAIVPNDPVRRQEMLMAYREYRKARPTPYGKLTDPQAEPHSITIGDILFNLVKRIISISKIQRRLFFNG